MTPVLDVALRRRLPQFTLDVRFALPANGILGVFGRSGAGKTTLIDFLAGIALPDTGHIRLDGTTWFDPAQGINVPPEERAIGYVFQDSRLFPHLSVERNLRYGLARAERRGRPLRIPFEPVVSVLGIGPLLSRMPTRLSGGERQRVALGRALLAQPRLLLMDEPLAALDAQRKAEVLPYIERLRDEFGVPAVYVTHSVEEITRLADHLVILAEGQVAGAGELLGVMSDPRFAPYFGRYEAGTVLECRVTTQHEGDDLTELSFGDGVLTVPRVPLAPGERVRVRIRAREVALALDEPTRTSISNRLFGRIVEMIERQGPYVEVVVLVGATPLRALITRQSAERLALALDVPIWVLIKAVALDRRSVAA